MNEANAFDKIVSVGMFEHVGEALLPAYFQQAWKLLRPGGVFLNHGIATVISDPPPRDSAFNQRYVFPDGALVPISTTLRIAEASGFEVRDVEGLREHYALTLRQWVRRLESHADEARQYTSEVTYRIWRIYMSASIHAFQTRCSQHLPVAALQSRSRQEQSAPDARRLVYSNYGGNISVLVVCSHRISKEAR